MTANQTKQYGHFITVEGIEGVGKSTSVKFLAHYLESKGISPIVTREPGGTPIAEEIRSVLLAHHEEVMAKDTELLLMFAGRAQHIARVIKPALAEGKWVICDRFADASFAYQGGGRGIGMNRIAVIEDWVLGNVRPNLTILLTAPIAIALQRARGRGELDRIEVEETYFFERTQNAYLSRAKQFPERFKIIDASRSPKAVQAYLRDVIDNYIKDHINNYIKRESNE